MNIGFRVDASDQIGVGHVHRCLVLAGQLGARGHDVFFMHDETLSGHMGDAIRNQGYDVKGSDLYALSNPIDWMIIDHYGLDSGWEKAAKAHAKYVMAIDDMRSRDHDCDLILDQNIYPGWEKAYDEFDCQKILGPQYLLLRDEFYHERSRVKKRTEPVKRIFLNLGGRDPHHYTAQILDILKDTDFEIDVVMGAFDQNVQSLCTTNHRWHYHENPDAIAPLMVQSDLAIGAGGSMTWERCAMGLPTIIIPVVDHQEIVAHHLVVENLALWCDLGDKLKILTMIEMMQQTGKLSEISENCIRCFPIENGSVITDILEKFSVDS